MMAMKPVVKKWMPAAAVPAMLAAYALSSPLAASAQDLPDKTPEQVIAMIIASEDASYSGNLRETADLGLPEMPERDTGGQPGAPPSDAPTSPPADGSTESPSEGSSDEGDHHLEDMLALLSGTHEARVFSGGLDKMRVQVMDGTDEDNYVLNGTSYWRYSSEDNTAVHTTLPRPPSEAKAEARQEWYGGSSAEPPTPEQLAGKLVDEADPSTTFAVEEGKTIAGRDVYTLRLTPKEEEQTLVANGAIGVDAETGVPLAITLQAVDQSGPAFTVEYTSFSTEAPDAALFDFKPPAGAEVVERPASGQGSEHGDWKHGCGMGRQTEEGTDASASTTPGTETASPEGTVTPSPEAVMDGEGWDTVVQVPSDCVPGELKDSGSLDQWATAVDGGHLIHTSLVNVLVTDDGRVYVGSVPQDRLQAVAGKE
jgi:outer membrane lipoprotein-sorting protein